VLWGFGLLVNPHMKVEVHEGSAAEKAGMLENDSIITIAGEEVSTWDEMLDLLSEFDKQTITVGLVREGTFIEKNLLVDMDSLGLMPVVPPVLGSLKRDGPAHKAGMRSGNRILEIDGEEITTWNQMVNTVRESIDTPLHFIWQDKGIVKEAMVTPVRFYDPTTQDTIGQIGAIMPLERRRLVLPDAIALSVQRSGEVIWLTLKTLYELIIGRISRRAIGGPIAIAQLSGESARWGFESLLGLLAIISINLGLINLFPIPALDGGHIVISVIEAIRNKRFSRRTRLILQQVGYAIILLLIVFVTFNDITR
jgi:regulator of sigma E protease